MMTDPQVAMDTGSWAPSGLSVVIPVYGSERALPELVERLRNTLSELTLTYELVLVNDCSVDGSWETISALAKQHSWIRPINLMRNYGQHNALLCGIRAAQSGVIVTMDDDLQHPPEEIPKLLRLLAGGYDVVYGQRERRVGESSFKLVTAWAFYRLMRLLVYPGLPVDTGDFRLISRQCLEGLQAMRETHRFLRGMVAWVGYPQVSFKYVRGARRMGQTKYPLRKMLTFAWTAATSFSTLPLKLSWGFGCLIGLFGIEEALRIEAFLHAGAERGERR